MKPYLTSQKASQIFTIFILGIIIAFAAYVRFVGLTREGMIGSDVFQYWQIAKWWTEGNFTLDGFYRPFIYLLFSLWMKIFGEYDYTLSVFNAGMDLINIFLIFIITKHISKKNYLALSAALVYATLPGIIHYSRISLVHIPSATFVLLSTLVFLKFLDTNRELQKKLFSFLTGLLVSLTAHIHPDLAFLAPVYLIYIVIYSLNQKVRYGGFITLKSLKFILLFLVGFSVPYIIGIAYYGLFMFLNTMLRERTDGAVGISPLQLWWQIIYSGIKTHTYSTLPLLFFGSIFIAIYQRLAGFKSDLKDYLTSALVLGYSLVGTLVLTRYIERLFIPIIPLVLISIAVWCVKLFSGKWSFVNHSLMVIGTIFFVYLNISAFFPSLQKYQSGYQSIYREAFDILKDRVNENDKILITPYIFYSHRKAFQAPFYFGQNARYIIEYPYDGRYLQDLIDEYNFSYVYIAKEELDTRIIDQSRREIPIDFYGLRLNNWENGYSVERELEIINNYLRVTKAKKIFESEHGIIYQL